MGSYGLDSIRLDMYTHIYIDIIYDWLESISSDGKIEEIRWDVVGVAGNRHENMDNLKNLTGNVHGNCYVTLLWKSMNFPFFLVKEEIHSKERKEIYMWIGKIMEIFYELSLKWKNFDMWIGLVFAACLCIGECTGTVVVIAFIYFYF